MLILLGVEKGDTPESAQKLVDKVLGYRIFADEGDKMNLNVLQAGAACWWCRSSRWRPILKGMRPSFSGGAAPAEAEKLYDYFVACCREKGVCTETGRFATDMEVALINDGPVTFWLQV